MLDPTYTLILGGLGLALLTALLIPAPRRPADDEGAIQLALLSAGCAATIVMGALALMHHYAQTTICGAIAWLLMMPCVWLSRAPRPAGEWDEDEDEDDGGGSPLPQRPSDPPAPDDRLPGLLPPMMPPARGAWGAPQPVPVPATAATVQRLLAGQEAERLRAAQEVRWLLAATAALPRAEPQPAATAEPPAAADPRRKPVHAPAPRLRPAPRARGEHRSIVHVLAAVAPAGMRRPSAIARRRARPAALRD